jgi:hypothetical protein
MANIVFRASIPATPNPATANNAAPLTNDQMDKNFYALKTEVEAATSSISSLQNADPIAMAIALG